MLTNKRFYLAKKQAITEDTVFGPYQMGGFRGTGLQLITENQVDVVVHDAADAADASDKTLTLANYTFTGKTGAKVTIQGSQDNDGTYTLTSVTSAHVGVFSAATFTDETFDDAVNITVERADDPLQGTWAIEACNDYSAGLDGSPNDGSWKDVTSWFGGDAPVTTNITDVSNQLVQADPFDFDAFRITFAYTDGIGTISIPVNQKGQ